MLSHAGGRGAGPWEGAALGPPGLGLTTDPGGSGQCGAVAGVSCCVDLRATHYVYVKEVVTHSGPSLARWGSPGPCLSVHVCEGECVCVHVCPY